MPIWSLTQERVDKLKSQMAAKKEEQTALELLSEKDLWCQDLDAFVDEWELQLREEADYQKTIRNTNRRASRKIGAGKGAGKAKKTDDDYAPKVKKAAPKIIKVEPKKSSANFLEAFRSKKPAAKPGFGKDGSAEEEGAESSAAGGLSDDDFDALMAIKPSRSTSQTSRAPSEQPVAGGRAKRAAAAAPNKWAIDDDEESDSDDDRLLGNIGDMVKGIGGGGAADNANGRVSLFAMNRPESSHGRSTSNDLPKVKSKPSKTFDISDGDETNYEMLARSSPQKAPPTTKDDLDSFLSMDEDDDILPLPKKVAAKTTTAKPAPKRAPKAKPVPKPAPVNVKKASEPKPVALSPAAKAYAAKQKKASVTKSVFSEDEVDDEETEDVEDEDDDSLPPQPAARARGRPARAAAAVKPKAPVYTIDSEDDDEMDVDDVDESAVVEDEPSDDFDESE
jgi:DNA topoisomerase-2